MLETGVQCWRAVSPFRSVASRSGPLSGTTRHLFGHCGLSAGLIISMISCVQIMTAAGMWEKAGILFADMGLERDLEDLQRIRLEM